MGIRDSFKRANETIEAARRDVERPKDEVAEKREQKKTTEQKDDK